MYGVQPISDTNNSSVLTNLFSDTLLDCSSATASPLLSCRVAGASMLGSLAAQSGAGTGGRGLRARGLRLVKVHVSPSRTQRLFRAGAWSAHTGGQATGNCDSKCWIDITWQRVYATNRRESTRKKECCSLLLLIKGHVMPLQCARGENRTSTVRSGGGVLDLMHGRSRMAISPRIPAMSGRSTSGLHRPYCIACTKGEAP